MLSANTTTPSSSASRSLIGSGSGADCAGASAQRKSTASGGAELSPASGCVGLPHARSSYAPRLDAASRKGLIPTALLDDRSRPTADLRNTAPGCRGASTSALQIHATDKPWDFREPVFVMEYSGGPYAIEQRETEWHVRDGSAIRGLLRILPHWNIRHVGPERHLQISANRLLAREIGRVVPSL